MKKELSWVTLIIMFIIIIGLNACSNDGHKTEIINKIQSEHNAKPINIEEKSKYFDDIPFHWSGKYASIYKFTYTKDGKEIVGWVRFNTFSDDWIMNEKDNK